MFTKIWFPPPLLLAALNNVHYPVADGRRGRWGTPLGYPRAAQRGSFGTLYAGKDEECKLRKETSERVVALAAVWYLVGKPNTNSHNNKYSILYKSKTNVQAPYSENNTQ